MQNEGGLKNTICGSILILIFEAIGTALLALNYNTGVNSWCGFLMAAYMTFILGLRISGSHFNPAITLAFMLRKHVGRFSRVLGIAYWIF